MKLKYLHYTINILRGCVQNPPSDGDASVTQPTDFHWAIPKISTVEKYFLSQLIATPSKDVSMLMYVAGLPDAVMQWYYACSNTMYYFVDIKYLLGLLAV